MDYVTGSVLTGAGATALMDLWVIARKRLLGVPALDYGLVGRWLAYLPRGRFRHDPIARTPQVRGERLIGWCAHYLIGVALAGVLLAVWGLEWIREPRLAPALIVGMAASQHRSWCCSPAWAPASQRAGLCDLAPRAPRASSRMRSSASGSTRQRGSATWSVPTNPTTLVRTK